MYNGAGLWSYQWGQFVDDCMGLCSDCPYGSAVRESPMGPVGLWYYFLYLIIDTADMSSWTVTSKYHLTNLAKVAELIAELSQLVWNLRSTCAASIPEDA